MSIYSSIIQNMNHGKKQFAVLIDPDKLSPNEVERIIEASIKAEVDFLFVGGSLLTNNNLESCLKQIKGSCSIPVILFPGDIMQINSKADGILLLSLISGRNAEMLIGKHVVAAPYLRESKLEILPTGYMLIDSGKPTTALYMSNSSPIPSDKNDIAISTAIAGEMLGLKLIYLDAGSGAEKPVPNTMITHVKQSISLPLVVGGGITTPEKAYDISKAGADLVVIGNAIENGTSLISEFAFAISSLN
ncbi:geranylgeranylglyceryl/heptaprenylglyceryl phosphate synthase [candidate division KSB1 bacterium]